MIKARAQTQDGRHLIVLGLSEGNLERLRAGQPIYIDLRQMNFQKGDEIGHIAIHYGKTEADLVKAMRPLIDKDTVVHAIPKGKEDPQ